MKPKILILTASYGSGHVIAAKGLEESFHDLKIPTETLDLVKIGGKTEANVAAFYEFLMKYGHGIWKVFHDKVIPIRRGGFIRGIYQIALRKKFFKDIDAIQPDIIISTMDTCSLVASLYKRAHPNVKVYTVITDYVAHALWVWKNMDGYFVGSENIVNFLIDYGIEKEKIKLTGIPLRSQFVKKKTKKQALVELGIPENHTVILISAGTYSSVPVEKIVKCVSGYPQMFLIILAGSKTANVAECAGILKQYGVIGRAVSYVDNMETYMAASDLYVSKAGGLTVAECFAVGLPALYLNNFPGHEEGNATYAADNGAAVKVSSGENLEGVLGNVLKEPEVLKKMKYDALKIALPAASAEITKQIVY